MNEPVRYELHDQAAWITLERPEAANALNRATVAALDEAIQRAHADKARAVVLQGAGGRAFSAGADLKERRAMTLEETRGFLDALGCVLQDLETLPACTIAAIDGVALGGGLELALACDIRIATDRSELGLLEVRVGIIPGAGGTQRLARLIGLGRAKEMIMLGRRVSAMEAYAFGLVGKVVESESLEWAANEVLE